jgi:hypothetical protein
LAHELSARAADLHTIHIVDSSNQSPDVGLQPITSLSLPNIHDDFTQAMKRSMRDCLILCLMECIDESDTTNLDEAINTMEASKKGFKSIRGSKEAKQLAQEIFNVALATFIKVLDTRRASLHALSEGKVEINQQRAWRLGKDLEIVAEPSFFVSQTQTHKVNDDLMGNIFRINRIPIQVITVPADGNCYFYSIRRALLDMEIRNLASAGVFASGLRSFIVCAVERYNEGSTLEESMSHQMQLDGDGEDLSERNIYVDQIPCSFRLCFAFKMDITCIAVIWNHRMKQFEVQVKYFRYEKEKYDKWSSDTTLKDKFSIHQWDQDADKVAIDEFRKVGGVANFVTYKESRFCDGQPLNLSSLFEQRPNHIVIGWTDVLCIDGAYRGASLYVIWNRTTS